MNALQNPSPKRHHPIWDVCCAASLLGIWPRFIEPKLIFTTHKTIPIPNLAPALNGIKILQFSDLHLYSNTSNAFLNKLSTKIKTLRPDIITFTGDFLCYGLLQDATRLKSFLNTCHAPHGCYAVLGNHDYNAYIGVNANGDYDLMPTPNSAVSKGFKRLSSSIHLTKYVTPQAKNSFPNHALVELLKETPFRLLHNETCTLSINNSKLNICGLGEHMNNHLDAREAFQHYDPQYPGIILLHNPDGIPKLKDYPGSVILCGHTHGGQINLPWLWKKFTKLENLKFKKGLHKEDNKWIYINRGVGSVLPLRLFSPPEIFIMTLEKLP